MNCIGRVGSTGGRFVLWLQDAFAETTSVLAAWKAGGAFIPLDSRAPLEFNLGIIKAVDPHAIIVDPTHLALLPPAWRDDAYKVLVWTNEHDPNQTKNLNLDIPPDTIARIVFTSGSTGKPKGVEHDQRGMLYRAATSIAGADFQAEECQLNLSPLAHVTGSTVLLNTLLIGGTLSCYPLREWGLERMAEWIARHQVTRFATVPTVFRRFMRLRDLPTAQLKSIRTVYLGAESTRWTDVALFRQFFSPGTKLITNIGSTETGPTVRYDVPADEALDEGTVPLGMPYPDIELRLLDEDGHEVPPGEVGEITIRSRGIACGYFGQPEQSAQLFPVDLHDASVRQFKTGDMGRFDVRQRLIYAGRRDRQLKIHGHRVELDYIAAVLRQHPDIEEVDVRTWPDHRNGVLIAAYFSTAHSVPLDGPGLRRWLQERVPLYMVPRHLQQLEKLPLHSSGKVNRQILPPPSSHRESTTDTREELSTMEQSMLNLWRDVLEDPTVGPDDNFFTVGGDSLFATRLLLEAERLAVRELPLNLLFHAPTPRQFARQIEQPPEQLSNLVCARATGEKSPLFWVHGWVDSLFHILPLARKLENDRPAFVIQCNQHCADLPPPVSVEAMVTHYADLIERQVPTGSCLLGGFSVGATFAFATATELLRRGRKVETVIVIDRTPTNLPTLIHWRMMTSDALIKANQQFGSLWRGEHALDPRYLKARWQGILRRFRLSRSTASPSAAPTLVLDYYTVLSNRFIPQPCSVPVLLIQSRKNPANLRAAWGYLSRGRVTHRWVAADHLKIVRPPHLTTLCELIRHTLADLE
jgi:acyl-coenzyme A synthetase/AMP-(fatty) acid ligase/thioesterase domain-containing protein